MKQRTLLVGALVVVSALATTVLLAYTTIWHLAIFSLIPGGVSLAGLVISLLAFIALRRAGSKPSARLHRIGSSLLVAGSFLLLQVTYFAVAPALRNWEVRQAQAFVHTLVPKLEAYHSEYDTYPTNVVLLLPSDTIYPRLLELKGTFPVAYDNRQFYFSRGATYSFKFYVPDGFIGFQYEYCCGAAGTWTVTD